MIGWLRTAAFNLLFIGGSIPIVLAAPIAALIGPMTLRRHVLMWLNYHRWVARWTVGIESRVVGTPASGPALYASKHQAMWETFELTRLLDAPAIVMKQELANIPVWGWAARRYGMIIIDREASAGALRRMMRDAQAALAEGRSVVIFPEGTRVKPGETPPIKSGFAGLYRTLKLPVVPVALDSGRLWPKRGVKSSGEITLAFQPEIASGLSREEIEARVFEAINRLEPNGTRS